MHTITCQYCKNPARLVSTNPTRSLYRCTRCRRLNYVDQPPLGMPSRFMCYNHQGKADAIIKALSSKFAYHQSPFPDSYVKFLFADSDVLGRGGQMRRAKQRGVRRFFVYPHSARPSLVNAHYGFWEGTTAQFVVNEYHAEVLRRYGYSRPIETMGWHLCEVKPFQPRPQARKVLFAPIHPRNAPIDRKVNKETFDRLYRLVERDEIELTVRHIRLLQDSGIEKKPGVHYVNSELDNNVSNGAIKAMDSADVVIGHQTFAWMAVARGVPCVMFAEDMPTHFRKHLDKYDDVACWNDVVDLFRFPLDLLTESDTMGLLERACASDLEIADWKRRMIGSPFAPDAFVEKVEKYL